MLDARGIVDIVEIIVYIPLVALCIKLLSKFGFKREGWIFLLLLAIIRIAGGITGAIAEQQSKPSTTLEIVAVVLQTAGISPLLTASLGFLGTVKQNAFEDGHFINKGLKLLGLLSHVAIALTIAGGVEIGEGQSSDGSIDTGKIKSGSNLKHIGVIMFVVQIVFTIAITLYMWSNSQRIMFHRRTLLKAVTGSLPFLVIRVLYTVLSAFAPLGNPGVDGGSPSLAKFNSSHGDFAIYLVMSVIMEFAVVIIYVTAGLIIPLKDDYSGGSDEGTWPLYANGAPGHEGSASSVSISYKPPSGPPPMAPSANNSLYP